MAVSCYQGFQIVVVMTDSHNCPGLLAHQCCCKLFVANVVMVLLPLTQRECTGSTVFGISVAEGRLLNFRFTTSGPYRIHTSDPCPTYYSIVGAE